MSVFHTVHCACSNVSACTNVCAGISVYIHGCCCTVSLLIIFGPIATVAKRTARGTLLVNTLYLLCLSVCLSISVCMVTAAGAGAGGVCQDSECLCVSICGESLYVWCVTVSVLCSPRQVRALVAFVRKRDRRVAAQQRRLQERAAENARRAEQRRQEQRQQRLQQMADYTEAEWSRADQHEQQLKVMTGGGGTLSTRIDALMVRLGCILR